MKRAIAIIFCLVIACNIASAATEPKLQISKATPINGVAAISKFTAPAASNTSTIANTSSSNLSQPMQAKTVTQSADNSGIIGDGLNKWGKGLIDGMYNSFDNSSVTSKFGTTRGALYTAITYVPNPYEDPTIEGLYRNYNNLAIFFVAIFIFGAWASRSLAKMKVTSNVFGDKDLSTSAFFGGLCMCFLALFANFFYMFALQIIQALSQFAMGNVMDSIAPSPDNLVLYAMMALCDMLVFVFFIVRYFIIYAVAVMCTIIAVLLVPEFSRDFAKKSIDHIVRILLLQPVSIFFTCLGIIALKNLPANSGIQAFGYVGLTVLVFLVCWYMLWGDFEFLKKAIKYAVEVTA